MKLEARKLPEFWLDITRNRDIAYKDRVWMEGYDAALVYCAEQLEAALAQQAGAVDKPVDWIAESHPGYWVVQVLCGPGPRYYSIRKSDGQLLELPHKESPFVPVAGMFASSGPGGGGEGGNG